MTVTKCDRCGNTIMEQLPEWHRVEFHDAIARSYQYRFDLCPACRNNLVTWIREGVKDDQI